MKPLYELGYDECLELLGSRSFGRVAIVAPDGPQIVPVNYVVHDGAVYIRTTPYNALGTYGRNTLVAFWEKHPVAEPSLRHWFEVTEAAAWQNPLDVMADFSKAKSLNGERVRFEVAGGDYRMVVAFDWRRSIAFVKFIGTHAEYDRIDALTVSLF